MTRFYICLRYSFHLNSSCVLLNLFNDMRFINNLDIKGYKNCRTVERAGEARGGVQKERGGAKRERKGK